MRQISPLALARHAEEFVPPSRVGVCLSPPPDRSRAGITERAPALVPVDARARDAERRGDVVHGDARRQCADRSADVRAERMRRKVAGECLCCRAPAGDETLYCGPCTARRREASRRSYRARRAAPKRVYRCHRCGAEGHFAKTCGSGL